MIGIGRNPQLRQHIEISPRPQQHRAGIIEVRLPLLLRRPQRVQHPIAPIDPNDAPAPGEGNGLPDPITRIRPRKDRILENRIEPIFAIVVRIAIPARIQPRQPEPHPVFVDARLSSGKKRPDLRRLRRKEAVPVLPQRPVNRCRQIDPPDPPIRIIAKINDIIIPPAQVAEQGRPHRKAIIIDLDPPRLAVHIIDGGDLAGEAGDQEVLTVEIGEKHPVAARRLHDGV